MAITLSPNMSLPIPGVGTEAGPDYATDVSNSLTLVDQHDHSPGSGIQITPAGLNINNTLTFNNNQATALKSASFIAQSAATTVLQALSVAPGTETPALQDLWYTDSAGTAIQLTSNGLVNAIIGSLPGESYSAGTFFWKQGTGSTVPANFDIGSIVLRPNVAATTLGISIVPPGGIASAWTLTLPADPAASGGTDFLLMNASGIVTTGALVDNSSIQYTSHQLSVKAGGITANMLASDVLPTAQHTDFVANGTFVVPSGVTVIFAEVTGGGGGGGGGGRSTSAGAGGGGSLPIMSSLAVTPGDSLAIVVGAGGTGGATQGTNGQPGNDGTDGGSSSITRSGQRLLFALGGNKGLGSGSPGTSFWNPQGQFTNGGQGNGSSGASSYYNTGGIGTGVSTDGGAGGAGGHPGATGGSGGASGIGSSHALGGNGYGAGAGGGQAGSGAGGNNGGAGGTGAVGLVRIIWIAP